MINNLTDGQICKISLWIIDELKEKAEEQVAFKQDVYTDKEIDENVFNVLIGETDSRNLFKNWDNDNDSILFARKLIDLLLLEHQFKTVIEETIQNVKKTRWVEEINPLVTVLSDTIPLWLLLYFSLKFNIKFKIGKSQDANNKTEKKIEFELDIGKKSSLKDFLASFICPQK